MECAVAVGVDERIDRVLRRLRLATNLRYRPHGRAWFVTQMSAGRLSQHAQAPLAVGLFWIPRHFQHPRVAHADNVQHAVTVLDLKRLRGAAALAGRDVRVSAVGPTRIVSPSLNRVTRVAG